MHYITASLHRVEVASVETHSSNGNRNEYYEHH